MDLQLTFWACKEYRKDNLKLLEVSHLRRSMMDGCEPFLIAFEMERCRIPNKQCRRLLKAYHRMDDYVCGGNSLWPSCR